MSVHIVALLAVWSGAGWLSSGVRGDYPPSSERGHGIYLEPSADWVQPDLRGSLGGPSAKCIDIPANLSLCRGIGYGQMRLPNLLDHDTVKEVRYLFLITINGYNCTVFETLFATRADNINYTKAKFKFFKFFVIPNLI